MVETEVTLAGQNFKVFGDSDDTYLQRIDDFIKELLPLEAWVRNNVPPNGIVIDIGGNIGITAMLLSTLLPKGHVHVFEALPSNFEYLKRNIEANSIENCTANSVAVGNLGTSVAMRSAGAGSTVIVPGSYGYIDGQESNIPMVTLDSYVDRTRLHRVDFIKMDIEGFEPAALEGAAITIERFTPPIFMEFNSWALCGIHGTNVQELVNLLWETFEICSINTNGEETEAGSGDAVRFLHDNMVLHRTVDDILLRLKNGARVPKLSSTQGATTAQLRHMHEHLVALRESSSWKITAPLRALRRVLLR